MANTKLRNSAFEHEDEVENIHQLLERSSTISLYKMRRKHNISTTRV